MVTRLRVADSPRHLQEAEQEARNLRRMLLADMPDDEGWVAVAILKGEADLAAADRQEQLRRDRLLEISVATEMVEEIDRCASIYENQHAIEDRICRVMQLVSRVSLRSVDDNYLGTEAEMEGFLKAAVDAEIRLRNIQKTGHLYRKPPRMASVSKNMDGVRR